MKKMVVFGLVCVMLFSANSVLADDNARRVFETVWERYRSKGTLYEKEEMWMILLERQDREPGTRTEEEAKTLTQKRWGVKRMTRYLKYDAGLLDRVYINFTYPGRESDTQFVIWRYPQKHDDMWMYSPALGDRKVRRIPTSAQYEDHFMGSALTYEDVRRLMGEVGAKAEIFNFSFLGSVIKVVPGSGVADTGYTERRFVVDKNLTFSKVYYYKSGQLAKIQKNSLISYQNGLWRPLLVEMYDVQKKFSTLLYFSERKFLSEKEVPEGIFEVSYLNRGR